MNNKERIKAYLEGKDHATVREIASQLGISLSMTHRYLRALLADGIIEKAGKPPKVLYALADVSFKKSNTSPQRERSHTVFGPPHAVFNLSKMGLRYFRLGIEASASSKSRLVEHFSGHPNVGWIFSAKGWFNLAVGMWAKDNSEINDISSQVRNILGKDDRIIFQSELTSLYGFGNRPVSGQSNAMCIVDAATHVMKLSPLELDYIKLIALDSSLSHKKLGKVLGVESEKVKMLQRNLTEKGIIVGFQERINYGGIYYKIFIDSLSGQAKNSADVLLQSLWKDPACVYVERANSKYDIEFEVIVSKPSEINKYIQPFSEYKIAILMENLYTNLYPLNKVANLENIGNALSHQSGSIIDLRDSKLWYLNYQGAESYLKIYDNKKYFEVMEKSELDLFDDLVSFVHKKYPKMLFCVTDIGSGNGLKGRMFIDKIGSKSVKAYYPIDIQPIELEAAILAHADSEYSKHPTLLDIENLSARFPLPVLPNEKQIHLFLGGTYGNFPSKKINSYLKPMVGESSLLLVTIPIVGGVKTDKEIIDSYTNSTVEDIAFGPLAQLGFQRIDFCQNPEYPNLRVHIAMEDRRLISFFKLNRNVNVFGKSFQEGTIFKVSTSWKPTLNEFREALEFDFRVEKIFHNKDMAIALVTGIKKVR